MATLKQLLEQNKQGSSNDYQRAAIAERESLIKQVGGRVPEKKKPKVGFLQRLSIIGDSLGAVIRTGIFAAMTPEKESVLGAAAGALVDRTKRKYGSDLLDEMGVTNKYGKAIGGFALDMALDPLSWVTGGAGGLFFKGSTVMNKAGKLLTLNKAGTKALQQTLSKIPKVVRPAGVTHQGEITRFAELLGRESKLAEAFIDKGGIKFMGAQTPLTAAKLGRLAQVTGISLMANKFSKTALGKAGTAIAELLVPDKKYANMLKAANIGPDEANQLLALRAGSRGAKSLAITDRTEFLKENYKTVIEHADTIGITSGNKAERIAHGMTYAAEGDQVAAQIAREFGEGPQGWDRAAQQLYDAEYAAQIERGTSVRKAIVAAKKKKQRLTDGKLIIDAMNGTAFPPALQDVYQGVLREYKGIAERDRALGFIRSKLDDYIYRGTKRVTPGGGAFGRVSKAGITGTHGKERVFDTILDIDLAANWEREYDFFKGVTIRGTTSDVNAVNKLYVNNLAKMAGVPKAANKSIPPGWVDGSSLKIPGVKGTFKGIMVPQAIADDLVKATKPFLDTTESKALLSGLETYMNQWKTGVTVYWPAFHIRNAVSNVFNASYLGGADMKVFTESMKYQKAISTGVGLDDIVKGTGLTVRQLQEEMIKHNLWGFGGQTQQALTGPQGARMLNRALGKGSNKVHDFAMGVGNTIETNSKMGSFIDRLRKGDSLDNAAMHVKKFLFDYDDLTDFERGTMKHLIPFYTWIRKNTPLQIEQMLKKPGKFLGLGRAMDAAGRAFGEELTPEEQAMLPDFAMAGIGLDKINLGKDKNGKFRTILSLGLPYEDLDKLGQAGKEILGSLTPPLKYILEEISGKEFFRNKPLEEANKVSQSTGYLIENFASDKVKELLSFSKKTTDFGTTYRLNPKLVHFLGQAPITRAGSTLRKLESLTDSERDTIGTALSLIVGMNTYNAEATSYFRNQERLEELNKVIDELYPKIKKFERLWIP